MECAVVFVGQMCLLGMYCLPLEWRDADESKEIFRAGSRH